MYLIADSGSTKTEWCVIDEEGGSKTYYTSGINPVYMSKEDVADLLNKEFPVKLSGVEKIFFYGAGCAFPDKNKYVEEALSDFFGTSQIEVASDLMAAARSLCKKSPGISCIIGTGSNSCYYDGKEIVHNVRPLGFILGDEGSGAVLGKKLVANVLKGVLSAELTDLFYKEYDYPYAEYINRVYRQPLPNRFLAGFTKFLSKYIAYPEIEKLVSDSLGEFIERNIMQYKEAKMYPVYFTGSIAFYFREQLEKQLKNNDLILGHISQSPMAGLVEFHNL